jgi:hypothetical protein
MQVPLAMQSPGHFPPSINVPEHMPPRHESSSVHGLASSQLAPSRFGGLLQTPVAGSHAPVWWQVSRG